MLTLEKGTEVGPYQLMRKLGEGGMGQVWLAYDPSMDRHVAIKLLSTDLVKDEEFLQRFKQEVKLSGRLQHKHVITAFEAGVVDDVPYMVMQYVKGHELEDVILEEGVFSEKRALKTVLKIAEALDYAWNEFKILHRDVKPSNIMIDEDGHAYLMDLGVSKSMNDNAHITMTGMVVGTPNYMSPEQAMGKKIDFRADAYSLGTTLYHMLTGEPPFEADNTALTLNKVLGEDLPNVRTKNPKISVGCQALVQRMTAKNPDDRYQDWTELKRDMVRILKGKPIGQRRESHSPYAAPGVKKKGQGDPNQESSGSSSLTWIIAVIAVILLVGGIIYVISWRSDTHTSYISAPKN